MKSDHVVLAITGASGSVYGLRLGGELLKAGYRLTILISRTGFDVIRHETGLDWQASETGENELSIMPKTIFLLLWQAALRRRMPW